MGSSSPADMIMKIVKDTVLEVLRSCDLNKTDEAMIHRDVSSRLGIDLSQPHQKLFIHNVIESFLLSYNPDDEETAADNEEDVTSNEVEEDVQGYDDNGNPTWHLSTDKGKIRQVKFEEYKKRKLIHIREYGVKKNGKLAPSPKGICFTEQTWKEFKDAVPDINAAFEKMKNE